MKDKICYKYVGTFEQLHSYGFDNYGFRLTGKNNNCIYITDTKDITYGNNMRTNIYKVNPKHIQDLINDNLVLVVRT